MGQSQHSFRPAARLLKTIGQDLIKDVYAAIVELVKNSYDADAPEARIVFEYRKERRRLIVRVEDDGHGMDLDTVVNKWMVPATSDKYERKVSTEGRVLQGRKGIGRFAAAVLGERILLETTKNGKTTSLIFDMEELGKADYLDQLSLEVFEEVTGVPNGTSIEIEKDNVSSNDVLEIWHRKQINNLLRELRSLISPEDVFVGARVEGYEINYSKFDIKLEFQNFPLEDFVNKEISIQPFPVLELYDYRISGKVDGNGIAKIKFYNQNIPSLPPEEFELKIAFDSKDNLQSPGEVYIDLRIYDRDPASIAKIIERGLKDPDTDEFVGKRDARRILDEYYGVGVYREQFRIRPYGEQTFDWLDLDKQRVQDPSRKIGHNQVMGFVYIRSEEKSGLTEKSARDGLTENAAYFGLVHAVSVFINQLQTRRYNYRVKAQMGRKKQSVEDELNSLFDFQKVEKKISNQFSKLGMRSAEAEAAGKVVRDALEEERKSKSVVVQQIRDTIALYQGQATLGRITHVLLHEGRKNIKYISETLPRVVKWTEQAMKNPDEGKFQKINDRSTSLLTHTKGLSHLFKKIEPFARTRRAPAKEIDLQAGINDAFEIFRDELHRQEIEYDVTSYTQGVRVVANEIDFLTVFSNLIENSVYWLQFGDQLPRKITVAIDLEDGNLVVDYQDNGPGFQGDNTGLMFDPGYSMKPNGTGLGLTLAGEAMVRMKGSIEARKSDIGARFTIYFRGK